MRLGVVLAVIYLLLLPGSLLVLGAASMSQGECQPVAGNPAVPAGTASAGYDLGPVTPQLNNLVGVLGPMFGIEIVGGYRASATDPNGHPAGLAADFMVPLTAAGKAKGEALAAYAQTRATDLEVDYIIWRQRIWSVARAAEGWRPMDDRGSPTENHFDHVHINVTPNGVAAPSVENAIQVGPSSACIPTVTTSATWVEPIPGAAVNSPYGPRTNPVTGEPSFHEGADYDAACGTPFRAASGGVVVEVGPDPIYGHLITIDHGRGSGQSIRTRYGHMYADGMSVSIGDHVDAGQIIGAVGSDGWSTGCHLHFTVEIDGETVDPVEFLASPPGAIGPEMMVAQANIKVSLPLEAFRADLASVTAAGPDFVTLNEVASRPDSKLRVHGYDAFRAPATAPASQTRSTAVLWRTDRWTKVHGARTLLVDSGPQRWDAGRSATWVVLQSAEGGRVSVVSVHHMVNPAKYGPDLPQRQRLYAEGMRRLQALVTNLSSHGPVFVAGDFNSQYANNDPWGPEAMLGEIGMSSTMDVLGKVTTTDGGGAIDYVFFQSTAVTPTGQQVRPLNSDHATVIATFASATDGVPPRSTAMLAGQSPPPSVQDSSGGTER